MKTLKKLFNIVIAAGIILLIGTAGFSDNSAAQLSDIAGKIIISFNLIIIGALGRAAQKHLHGFKIRLCKRIILMAAQIIKAG